MKKKKQEHRKGSKFCLRIEDAELEQMHKRAKDEGFPSLAAWLLRQARKRMREPLDGSM